MMRKQIISVLVGTSAGLIYWQFHPDWFALILAVLVVLLFDNQAALTRRVAVLECQLEEVQERLYQTGEAISDTNAHVFDVISRQ